jgi:hypothetical protein
MYEKSVEIIPPIIQSEEMNQSVSSTGILYFQNNADPF